MSAPPSTRPTDLPVQFGHYRIVRKLGQGGMGVVYLAEDTKLKRQVALDSAAAPDENETEAPRFRQAVQAVAPLRHPAICPIYEAGVIDGVSYLTMAYIEGPTLAEQLAAGPWLATSEGVSLIRRLAVTLAEAHKNHVVHRDVKPSNVILDAHGEPVLLDFGLARSITETTRLTRSRALLGTPAYMARSSARREGQH